MEWTGQVVWWPLLLVLVVWWPLLLVLVVVASVAALLRQLFFF
jgi:hypothetical protein